MAKARKHEMTKEELRAPDEVQLALKGFWENLYKYRKLLLGGVGALLALGVVLWLAGVSKRSGLEGRAAELREATQAIGASVGPEPVLDPRVAKLPRPPRFENESARLAAVSEGLAKFQSERAGDDVTALVAIAAINARLNRGEGAAALADIDAWLGEHADSPARPIALELKARAQVASGGTEAAIATLDELSKLVGPGVLRAAALARVGDLENPVLNHGAGDVAKARNAYDAALAALPPEEPDQMSMLTGKPGLRGQIENYRGLLP